LIESRRSKRALPPQTVLVKEGGVCQRSTPPPQPQIKKPVKRPIGWTGPTGPAKIIYKCVDGLVCAAKPEQRMMTGINMYCLTPEEANRKTPELKPRLGVVGLGEACSQPSVRGAPKMPCEKGLVCKAPANGMKGAPHTCQYKQATGLRIPEREKLELAEEGEVCSRPIYGFETKLCAPGLECRPHNSDRMMKGVSSYCLPPAEDLAQEGEVCYRPTPDFKRRECEAPFLCRPRDGDEQLKGISSYCLPPKMPLPRM